MSTPKTTVLKVAGMSCENCVRHVGEALRELPGVRAVDVQLADGRVTVEHEPTQPPVEVMLDAVREAGYEAAAAS